MHRAVRRVADNVTEGAHHGLLRGAVFLLDFFEQVDGGGAVQHHLLDAEIDGVVCGHDAFSPA